MLLAYQTPERFCRHIRPLKEFIGIQTLRGRIVTLHSCINHVLWYDSVTFGTERRVLFIHVLVRSTRTSTTSTYCTLSVLASTVQMTSPPRHNCAFPSRRVHDVRLYCTAGCTRRRVLRVKQDAGDDVGCAPPGSHGRRGAVDSGPGRSSWGCVWQRLERCRACRTCRHKASGVLRHLQFLVLVPHEPSSPLASLLPSHSMRPLASRKELCQCAQNARF